MFISVITNCFVQKMEVLRQDVEAMEREMEELRAYLAKTDENRDGTEVTIEDDHMDFQEDGEGILFKRNSGRERKPCPNTTFQRA